MAFSTSRTLATILRSSRQPKLISQSPRIQQTRAGSGGPHFNQPSGWLFGERPLKEGEKRVREDWELIWYIGFWGTTALGIVMHIYKPDRSITTWARHEAEQRMEKPTYEKS